MDWFPPHPPASAFPLRMPLMEILCCGLSAGRGGKLGAEQHPKMLRSEEEVCLARKRPHIYSYSQYYPFTFIILCRRFIPLANRIWWQGDQRGMRMGGGVGVGTRRLLLVRREGGGHEMVVVDGYGIISVMEMDKLPYYLFLVVRPDGNTAFSRIHEQYPLQLDINQLLTLGSNLNNLNTMQAQIIHPDIRNNRQEEVDLAKNTSIKSISASTFQMRFLDTVSGYMFIISASNLLEQRKLDLKLDLIYKAFVDYVIKAPFFNTTEKVDNPIFLKKCNEILYSY